MIQKKYLLLFIVILLVELYIGFYVHDAIIRPYIGDLLVVILMYSFVKIFWKADNVKVAAYAFVFSCLVEFAQYFKLVNVMGLGENKLARVLIGTSFSWIDILAYFGGFLVIVIGERYMNEKK